MSSPAPALEIIDLAVSVDGKEIVKRLNLRIASGEKHALMGPNGSGKSTLSNALMGHPAYKVTRGRILLDGRDITGAPPDERSRMGLFLAFQYPVAIPGVTVANFLRSAVRARHPAGPAGEPVDALKNFRKDLRERLESLEIDQSFMTRYVNDNFSGGEKKRLEMLQMLMLRPSVAVLDEIDSGLDIDALKTVARGIGAAAERRTGLLVITHYSRLLELLTPDFVHVLFNGTIIRSGGPELARALEESGYESMAGQAREPNQDSR